VRRQAGERDREAREKDPLAIIPTDKFVEERG
jgi:hypothetical protein